MPDAAEIIRIGESRPLFGSATAESGTLTLTAATVSLYDSAGAVVTGWNDIAVTGYDVAAAATVQAWKSIEGATAAVAGSAVLAGSYLLAFRLAVTGSDGLARVYRPTVGVTILPLDGVAGNRGAYPNGEDLRAYLEASGFVFTDAQGAQLAQAVAAGIRGFERDVRRRMLADAVAVARTFPQPAGNYLSLPDFISASGIVYTPYGGTAETLVLSDDYWLEPVDGLGTGAVPYAPYSGVGFRRYWWGLPFPDGGTVAVTARWGYAATIPDDAWQAMLAAGAGSVVAALGQAASGGLASWTEGDVSENYGARPFGGLLTSTMESYTAAVRRYRRQDFHL